MEQEKRPKFVKKIGYNEKRMKIDIAISTSVPFIESKKMSRISNDQNYGQVDKESLKQFTVVGMIRNQIFCIYHITLGLFASVDQHAMHERVRYQYFCKILQNGDHDKFIQRNIHKRVSKKEELDIARTRSTQMLIFICQINAKSLKWRQKTKFGFKLTIDENGKVYLRGYSYLFDKTLNQQEVVQICKEIVTLELENNKSLPHTLDSLIAQSSCKGAIKFGDQVTKQWCHQLLYNASLCTFPWKCVHGRATVHFEQYSIKNNRSYNLE